VRLALPHQVAEAPLEALLSVRQGRPDDAVASLLVAFTAFRTDAWPHTRVQLRAFDLAVESLAARPGVAARFLDSLKVGPFPGYLMEGARRQMLVRLELHRWQKGEGATNIGYSLLEPWSFWSAEHLRNRYTCYNRTGLGDASRARRELEEFLAADSAPFDREIEAAFPSHPATPDRTAAR
jgi:hypothetical protein